MRRALRLAWLIMPLAATSCATRGRVVPGADPAGPGVCAPGQYIEQRFEKVSVRRGVVYSRPTDQHGVHGLRMDIYEPREDPAAARPAIVWVHGGRFKTGDRSQFDDFAEAFAQRGYVSASIDYRLLRDVEPGAAALPSAEVAQSDAQAAIRYLRAHAARLRIDPSRVAIAGYSAGSITAFQVGYRHDFMGDNTENPEPLHTVSAVVGMDGFLIGPDDISPNDPPFALFRSSEHVGEREEAPGFSALLARALELGIHAEMHVLPGTTHLTLVRRPHARKIVLRAAAFLRRFVACN